MTNPNHIAGAHVVAVRRVLESLQRDLAAIRARQESSWEPFCIVRNRLEQLNSQLGPARRDLGIARNAGQSPYDPNAVAAWHAHRDARIAQASTKLENLENEHRSVFPSFKRLEAAQKLMEGERITCTNAIAKAQAALDTAAIVDALGSAGPVIAEIAARMPPAELAELLQSAIATMRKPQAKVS